MTYEIALCFSGFYESIYDSEIDGCIDNEVDNQMEALEGFERSEVWQIIFDRCDFNTVHQKVAALYVDAFGNYLAGERGLMIDFKFNALQSPREYNFTTDRVFAGVTFQEVRDLCSATTYDAIKKVAKEEFTSRSGFISFYSPDITTWGHRRSWDHNQLMCILQAILRDDDGWEMAVFYEMNEGISNIVSDAIDWPEVERDIADMIADEQDGLCDIVIPRGDLSPQSYIQKFNEINHLMGD